MAEEEKKQPEVAQTKEKIEKNSEEKMTEENTNELTDNDLDSIAGGFKRPVRPARI